MNEFLLLFRNDKKVAWAQSPKEMQSLAKQWQDWIGSVAAQNRFVGSGDRMSPDGRVVKPGNVVTDGPYAEIKEALAGYMTIRAKDYDDAVAIAKGCPIIRSGGNVEVRRLMKSGQNG